MVLVLYRRYDGCSVFFRPPYRLTRPLISESNFKVMGLITLNERDETILALRVIICGLGDGRVIKLHHTCRHKSRRSHFWSQKKHTRAAIQEK